MAYLLLIPVHLELDHSTAAPIAIEHDDDTSFWQENIV